MSSYRKITLRFKNPTHGKKNEVKHTCRPATRIGQPLAMTGSCEEGSPLQKEGSSLQNEQNPLQKQTH